MIKRDDKGGQFYLIAALIIIAIIVGVVTISNYTQREEVVRIYDLGEEIGIESGRVLEFGTFTGEDTNLLLNRLVDDYIEAEGEDTNLLFIFGNRELITVRGSQELRTILLESGGSTLLIEGEDFEQTFTPLPPYNIDVTIGSDEKKQTYSFKLKKGENFYFIISQEVGDEEFVVTG